MFLITEGFLSGGALLQGYTVPPDILVFAGDAASCSDGSAGAGSVTIDTFGSTGSTVSLASHAPDGGGTWTVHPSYAGNDSVVTATTGRLRGNSNGLAAYYWSGAPYGADLRITAPFFIASVQGASTRIHARMDTAADTYYFAGWSNSGTWQVGKRVAGTETILASSPVTLTVGNTYTLALDVSGTSLTLSVNGAVVLGPVADSSISAAGKVGLSASVGLIAPGDSKFIQVDSIAMSAPGAAGGHAQEWVATLLFGSEAWTPSEPAASSAVLFAADRAGGGDSAAQIPGVAATGPIVTQGYLLGISYVVPQGYGALTGAGAGIADVEPIRVGESQWIAASTAAFDRLAGIEGGPGVPGGGPPSAVITQAFLFGSPLVLQGYEGAAVVGTAGTGTDAATLSEGQWLFNAWFSGESAAWGELAAGQGAAFSGQAATVAETGSFAVSLFAADSGALAERQWVSLAIFATDAGSAGELVGLAGRVFAGETGRVGSWSPTSNNPVYRIYANAGDGGPIDYGTIVDSLTSLGWVSSALACPGVWKFGVRVYDPVLSLEESNVDAVVTLRLDGSGVDISSIPVAPTSLAVSQLAGGGLRLAWIYPAPTDGRLPTGFKIYCTAGGAISYATVAATVAWSRGTVHYSADIPSLSPGAYTLAVRAYNAAGTETGTGTIAGTVDTTAPDSPDSLVITTEAEELD